MKPIVLFGASTLLSLFLIGCEGTSAGHAHEKSAEPRPIELISQNPDPPIGSTKVDTAVASTSNFGSNKLVPIDLSPNERKTKQSKDASSTSKEPRRFYNMPPRTVDSLVATFGAVARLHPEDRALFDRAYSTGKEPNPVLDPKTQRTLPFPYAFPDRYAADIRRLDSIKAADSLKKKH